MPNTAADSRSSAWPGSNSSPNRACGAEMKPTTHPVQRSKFSLFTMRVHSYSSTCKYALCKRKTHSEQLWPLRKEKQGTHMTGRKVSKCTRPVLFLCFSLHISLLEIHTLQRFTFCLLGGGSMGRMLGPEANWCKSQDGQPGDQHLYLPLESTLQPETQTLYTPLYFF